MDVRVKWHFVHLPRLMSGRDGYENLVSYIKEIRAILQQSFGENYCTDLCNRNGVWFKYASDAVRFKLMCGQHGH